MWYIYVCASVGILIIYSNICTVQQHGVRNIHWSTIYDRTTIDLRFSR